MTRAMTVILVAALCAALLGVDESLSAAQDDAAGRQRAISTRVSEIAIGSVVKVELNDGRKVEGVLAAKTPDSITVDIYQRPLFRRPRLVSTDTIQLGDVKEIKKPLTGTQKALIVTGIVVGSCAALAAIAASSLDVKSPQTVPSSGSQQAPAASDTEEPSVDDQGSLTTTP